MDGETLAAPAALAGDGRPLSGKVALVTGSTSGIGLGIATALAAAGADIVLNGLGQARDIDQLTGSLVAAHGVRVRFDSADMTRPEQIRKMIGMATSTFGAVDILVNNAGIQHTAPVETFPDDRWDAILAINLSAAFHAIKTALPGMRQRGWGRIVNIASAHGLVASAQKAGYVAAKHGLVGLTKVVAIEAANTGVTCNAICPGWVLTPLVQKQIDAKALAEGIAVEQAAAAMLREKQPMLRFTTSEQLASLALFLCSDGAATITGTALPMDGGWVAQ
ncbi:MAG TPA: 3-hydroxybutyrate dehydrogenase [Stellaceae bacterium]|nr:3-hydroxybutyrate dehydrogenase [Stellaceae bacterium]